MALPVLPTNGLNVLLNLIIQNYLHTSHSICILWHPQLDFQLESSLESNNTDFSNYAAFLHIRLDTLHSSFAKDIYNFAAKERSFIKNGLEYDALIQKLTVAIEHTHCESFIAFQEHIPLFMQAFLKAATFSIWRSQRVKFLFIYQPEEFKIENYLHYQLIMDQPNILFVETPKAQSTNTTFALKMPTFLGTRFKDAEQLLLVDTFNAKTQQFAHNSKLYDTNKLKNLHGREVVLGIIDYPPFGLYRPDMMPNTVDRNPNNPTGQIFMDGCEVRILKMFCDVYNCTLQTDSTETGAWGTIYPNVSGDGTLGMLAAHKIDVVTGAVYRWYIDYQYFEISNFFGFSGVACMVPRPKPLVSWNLPLKPFQLQLWLGIVICLCIETLALMASRRVSSYFEQANLATWREDFKFGYVTSLKLYISQSSTTRERSNTVRIVLFSCFMIDIIITSIYGGGLASILTLPIMGEAPDSVQRMYKYKLKWAGQEEAWMQSLIHVVDDPVLVGVREQYQVMPAEEMAEKAKTEYMGFIVEELSFGYIANIEFLGNEALDRLKLMVDFIFSEYTTSFSLRLWPLLPNLNHFILAYHSSGFGKVWEWRTSVEYLNGNKQQRILQSRDMTANIGPVKLAIDHFAGLLLIWTIGMLLSLAVFAIELYLCKEKQVKAFN